METHLPPLNSTMRNKKVLWLCTMGRDNLTNQWTDLIAQHLKCCFGRSEMPEQNSSSKYLRSQTAGIHLRKQWSIASSRK